MGGKYSKQRSILLWIIIPLALFILQIFVEIFLSKEQITALVSENGPYEWAQVILTGTGFFLALLLLTKKEIRTRRLYVFWFGLAALGCFYIAGEEVSWGQHVAGWQTNADWAALNDQNETNLHNTSSWFDQKPRLLLLIGVIIGTLILPFWKSLQQKLPQTWRALIPPPYSFVLGLLVLVPHLWEKLWAALDYEDFFTRYSEMQELYLFYFIVLYLVYSYHRLCFAEKT